jgi:AcrR family transcriptional regulator
LADNLISCSHPGRMKGDERREQILAAAISLFSKHGFSGTTTKEIAKAAGVSEAMVFRHFANKDALYGAILDNKACNDGVRRFPWEGNPAVIEAMAKKDDFAFFYNIAVSALEKHHSDVGFMRLLFYSALEDHELAHEFFSGFIARIYEFIGDYIKSRQADGAMREIKPKIAVRAFLGMLIHHSLNNILWDKNRKLLSISNEEAARNFTEVLLQGIRK